MTMDGAPALTGSGTTARRLLLRDGRFYGRKQELARIDAALSRTLASEGPQLVLVAGLGFSVDERVLLAAYDGEPGALHAALWKATALANVVYRWSTGYRFLHDRVRDAADARIPEDERTAMHLRIGRRLRAQLDPAVPTDLHAILEQFNRALSLVEDRVERREIGRLARLAAEHARSAGAWTSARAYLRRATSVEDEPTFELALALAEADLRLGPAPDARLEHLLALSTTRAEELRVHASFARLGAFAGSYSESAHRALAAFESFGIALSDAAPSDQRVDVALRRSRTLLEITEKLSRTGTFGWVPVHHVHLRSRNIARAPDVECVGVDVTQHQEALRALKRSEENLRRVIDTIPTLVWYARADGSVEFFNQRWLDYTGLTMEAAAGWDWLATIHVEDVGHLEERWRAHLTSGNALELEARLRRIGGEHRWFLVRVEPLRDDNGELAGWYGTFTDIEDRKRAEDALHRTRAELSHVNRVTTVGELAASIAHEINQPLAAIVADATAASNWLAAPSPGIAQARESLDAIARDGVRVSEVLNRIRALLSRRAIAPSRCDVGALIHGVLPLVHPELVRAGVQVEADLGAAPPVDGDIVQLQQVLINLLINARDASRDVSADRRLLRVRLATTERERRRFARISVEDAGIGLGVEPARVFEPFFTTKADGLGMGLAISRSIIERHGGKLWAETNERHGATFHITLPEAS